MFTAEWVNGVAVGHNPTLTGVNLSPAVVATLFALIPRDRDGRIVGTYSDAAGSLVGIAPRGRKGGRTPTPTARKVDLATDVRNAVAATVPAGIEETFDDTFRRLLSLPLSGDTPLRNRRRTLTPDRDRPKG